MAYLVKTTANCQSCRASVATVEVFNHRNASVGQFCDACAQRRVRQLTEEELRRENVPAR